MQLFTVGHSNHSIKTFIELLQKHDITALADVRSHPYSRYLLTKKLPPQIYLPMALGAFSKASRVVTESR